MATRISGCGTRRLCTLKGLSVALICVLFCGCAGQRDYDAADFPAASSAAGGESVAWNGKLLDIRQAARSAKSGTVWMGTSPRWTLVFRIVESKPRIPPFAAGKKLILAVPNPLYLLQTNDFRVGDSFKGNMMVWRGTDGRLHGEEK
jgi:hypothetical protein